MSQNKVVCKKSASQVIPNIYFRFEIFRVLSNSVLFGGTVPPNSVLFGGTVPPNSVLFGGKVLPNSFFHEKRCQKYFKLFVT